MTTVGIDYGDRRIGVSFSDAGGHIAGESFTLSASDFESAVERLAEAISKKGAEEIVLGYPRNMDGSLGPRAMLCEEVAEALRGRTGLPVVLWDERRTTISAHGILTETGRFGKARKSRVDAVAASIILQSYLDFKANKRS